MTLLEMSLTGSAMIVLIIVLRALLINKLPKRTFVCLWALALIRLMLPFSIPVALPWAQQQTPSLYPLVVTQTRDFARQNLGVGIEPLMGTQPWPGMADPQMQPPEVITTNAWPTSTSPVQSLPASPIDWLSIIYFAGAGLVGLYLLSAYVLLRREFRKSVELHGGPAVAFVKSQSLRRKVRVLASGRIKSPITYGLIRPCVLLPESMADNTAQLPYVLTHELTHIRRLDAPMKLLFAICLCMHWFNPLVWAMYILYNRDVELACDERVVRELGVDTRAGYATLLLKMQEGRNRLTPLCNSFSRYSLKERIVSIAKYKKTSTLAMLLALVLVVSIATGFATRAEQAPVPTPTPAPTYTPELTPLPDQYVAYADDDIVQLLTEQLDGGWIEGVAPLKGGDSWRLYGTDESDVYLLQIKRAGNAAENVYLKREGELFMSHEKLTAEAASLWTLLGGGESELYEEYEAEGVWYTPDLEPFPTPLPVYTPVPTPRATNNPAWIEPWPEEAEVGDWQPDPGVENLMQLDWQHMSVAEFCAAVEAEIEAQGGAWNPTYPDFMYIAPDPTETEYANFLFGPLRQAFIGLNSGFGAMRHPGDPAGEDFWMVNPDLDLPRETSLESIGLDGYLSYETLDKDGITVGERNRLIGEYYSQLKAFFLSKSVDEWLAIDPIAALNAERDRLTEELSTPALTIRAINFGLNCSTDKGSFQTPASFIDNVMTPPEQTPVAADGVRVVVSDKDMGINYGVLNGDGVISPDGNTWHENGWRDPATGVRHRYDPVTDMREVSVDNGRAWCYEFQTRYFGIEGDDGYVTAYDAQTGWLYTVGMQADGPAITLSAALGLAPEPQAAPTPKDGPEPTPGAGWMDQKWDESNYKEADPRVAGLMKLDWRNMSVTAFNQEVRRAVDTGVDDWPLDWRDLYGTYEDSAVSDFIFGPLQRAMIELGDWDDKDVTLWHPGDPRGSSAFAFNPSPEAYADDAPHVLVEYLLTCDTLQADAITVAEREEILATYQARMNIWLNQRDMNELIQGDLLPLIRAERDRLTNELSTPELYIRAINFRGRYFDGTKTYETPGDFVDNMENPPNDPPMDDPNIEEIHYSNLTKIRVGTIYKGMYDEDMGEITRQSTDYFVSMGGQDQPWHADGWRDPATGLSIKFFPDLAWPLISPDNGMSWWRESIPDGSSPDGSMDFHCVINTTSSQDLTNWTLWYTPTSGWRIDRL